MQDYPVAYNCEQIAQAIIERSPSIALRIRGVMGDKKTLFMTSNIATYGYDRDDFLSGRLCWRDIIHPDDCEDVHNLLTGFAEMGNDQYSVVYRIIKADGQPVWISDSSLVVRDDDGNILYSDCIISDYTETKEHIEKIGENFHQQAVLNEILQGIHDTNLDKAIQIILDSAGAYLDISRVLLFQDADDRQSARVTHEWCNQGIPSLLERGDYIVNYQADIPEIAADLAARGHSFIDFGKIPPGCADEMANEGVTAAAVFAVKLQDRPWGSICFLECVKERRWSRDIIRFLDNVSRLVAPVIVRWKNEQIIESMALTDQLTGLNNRHYLETCLTNSLARARDIGQCGYVLFLDMDDFKIINDAYGHDYGDAILREVSGYLKYQFGEVNTVFRFGGDEFIILVEPEKAGGIYDIINSLLTRAQLPWTVLDRTFYCTLSVGVVRFPEGRDDAKEVIKNADIAMYQAKKMGKNNYVLYTSTLDNDSVARAEIETAMRESIENGFQGFEIHYQPLVDQANEIVGAEALVRWTQPDGKRLSPNQFVPLAEYLGLIIPIGEFALGSAALCCQKINHARPDFFVSVNVSVRQFKQPEFMEKTLRLLGNIGIKKTNVVLELTEGMAVHDMQRMKLLAGELRKSGIRISMDDFGTGYSSLGNMRELPFDVVKIDRSFIHDVTTDAYSKHFIRFITELVHSMGRKVCIEGVETQAQLRYCRECTADYVQGFHLWRPMPEDQLLDIIASNQDRQAAAK